MKYNFKMLQNECWWGGSTINGNIEPFDASTDFAVDFNNHTVNQVMPMLLSSKGRYIWSDNAFALKIQGGIISIDGESVTVTKAGNTLRDAYLSAMNNHFPFEKNKLPEVFFSTAQYNTWMQFTYDPTAEGVLKYAHDIIDNGFTPGVFIIDEGWHGRYGAWEFDFHKFPDPKKTIDELHKLGFIVMLWVVPFVCTDGLDFIRSIRKEFNSETWDKLFYRNKEGNIALVNWWNGYSAILDMTKQCDRDYMDKKLHYLMDKYGVDGFKFDGGNAMCYTSRCLINGTQQTEHTPAELNVAWNDFGRKYKYHEYKDTFNGGGKAVIQRLQDRNHSWDSNGIDTIIPSALVQGLEGFPYICPDMIGGGEWTVRTLYSDRLEQELFVRMAQVSALFPMMQFSWAPWEALDETHLEYVREASNLHSDMADEIISLIDNTRLTGEPALRLLEYNYPHKGYEKIKDEFMLGTEILVAPVVTKGAVNRTVVFPEGRWQSQYDGNIYEGDSICTVPSPINVLPWFRKL